MPKDGVVLGPCTVHKNGAILDPFLALFFFPQTALFFTRFLAKRSIFNLTIHICCRALHEIWLINSTYQPHYQESSDFILGKIFFYGEATVPWDRNSIVWQLFGAFEKCTVNWFKGLGNCYIKSILIYSFILVWYV